MSNRLLNYRLEKLEETVTERKGAIERLYLVERDQAVTHEQIKEINQRLGALEHERSAKP